MEKVIKILGGDEIAKKAVELLLENYELGSIKEVDWEVALTLDYYRLAVPMKAYSLSWNQRFFGSEFEIPYVVRFFFRDLKRGGASKEKAITDYFEKIGEKRPENFVTIFDEIVKRSKNLIVCAEDVVDVCLRLNYEPGAVIAEMKGAGLISPFMGCGKLGRARAPLYEINRFFSIL
ncbi:MAG: hypothetical protein NZ895_03120 [Archaeoglobaceae archaeon]|nr:hypothetical protein [Archaeoglobaceae archaeon]MCX8152130.1 hypothetical protein [Archaeoglobaceae archaeon]MDW8013566.1 hypothetical protein [Archaeoglobaceae archaeon]